MTTELFRLPLQAFLKPGVRRGRADEGETDTKINNKTPKVTGKWTPPRLCLTLVFEEINPDVCEDSVSSDLVSKNIQLLLIT